MYLFVFRSSGFSSITENNGELVEYLDEALIENEYDIEQ